MATKFSKEEMEAHTGKSIASKAKWRVKKVVPEYFEWPRRLRQIYIMLDTHGSSDAAINAIIEEFNWDKEDTWAMITGEHNFLERVIDYREKKEYPRAHRKDGKLWHTPLTAEHLAIVFAEEARFEALAKLMNADKGAGVAQHMRAMVENAGFFGVTDSISEKPAIELDSGGKPTGLVIDPEDSTRIRAEDDQGRKEASLIDDWDWNNEVEEEDGVHSASETEGDASLEGEGEVGAGRA